MSLQVCHCGWSKVTTDHGLRIHQGKMGCMQRGVSVKEKEQQYMWEHVGLKINQKDFDLDVYTPIKTDYYSDMSLQECHCGWSKLTTYHGLRTHQGKMGCTPKGVRIPKNEQWNWNNHWKEVDQMKHQPAREVTVKKEKEPFPPSPNSHTISAEIYGTTKVESKSPFATPQSSSQRATKSKSLDFSNHPQMSDHREMTGNWTNSRKHSATTATIQEEPKSPLAIPLWSSQIASKSGHQLQDFSTEVQVNRSVREYPIIPNRETVVRPKEKHRKDQTPSQPFQGSSEAEWLEISNVFLEVVRVAEDAKQKSLDLSLSTLRTTTSTMMEQIHQKLEKLTAIELKWMSKFAVDVELDPTTAHRCLVSAYGKKVSNGGGNQKTPGRFGSVFGLNRFTSGKSYWEVVVSNNTGWTLGIARGNAKHKRKLSLNPHNGYWVTKYYKNKYAALTVTPVRLSLKEKPQKVGVFVDYEEGLVSFYDVTAQSHIYSFTECGFTGEIYPYFILDGEIDEPLIISTVKQQ